MNHESKILTEEQIGRLYSLMKLGDIDARNQLIESNTGLIGYIVKKYLDGRYSVDDLFSVGCIGLIRAIDTFDIKKGISLCSYAYKCIENAILAFLRDNKKFLRTISLDDYISKNPELRHSSSRVDYLIDPSPNDSFSNYELEEMRKIIRYAITDLDEREQTLVLMRFGFLDGQIYTQKEISEELGLSRPYVSRIEKKVLCKLRRLPEIEELR